MTNVPHLPMPRAYPAMRLKVLPKYGVYWLTATTPTCIFTTKQYLLALTLGKVCQGYPYLVRLNKHLAADPSLIVDWRIPGRKQLVAILLGVEGEEVTVSSRRITLVKEALQGHQVVTRVG